jgi:hypothetical protein
MHTLSGATSMQVIKMTRKVIRLLSALVFLTGAWFFPSYPNTGLFFDLIVIGAFGLMMSMKVMWK